MHSVSSGRTSLTPPPLRLLLQGANALDDDTPHINQTCRRLFPSHLLAILPMTRRTALAKTTGQLLHGTTGRAAGGLASGIATPPTARRTTLAKTIGLLQGTTGRAASGLASDNKSCQLAILTPRSLGPLHTFGTAGPSTWVSLRCCFVWPAPRSTWLAAAWDAALACPALAD